MINVYFHFYENTPRYVGEGKDARMNHRVRRGPSPYAIYSRAHANDHCCKVLVSRHENKHIARLQEQGMIAWIGTRFSSGGPLLNATTYTCYGAPCGYKHTEETKAKISKASSEFMKGRSPSKETREKISKTLTGRKLPEDHPNKRRGRKDSEETRLSKSKGQAQRWKDNPPPICKGVKVVMETGKAHYFRSQSEAGRFFNTSHTAIRNMINHSGLRFGIKSIELV